MSASDAVLLVVVLAGLAYIASGAEGLERTRVTWIVGGIALAPVVDLTWAAADIASAITGDASTALLALQAWCDALLPWFGLCGIVAVLYGFLSQRVVDLRLAIGRAAIYGAMTVVLVVIFGAIEWLAGQIFDSTRPAQYVSLIAALGIGFAMQTVHGRMEELLNRLLFRSQRRAEDALRRAARAIAHTTSEQTVNEFLIDEPVAILGLTAAAFYLAREEGERLVLTAHAKMPERCPQGFDPQDPLVTTLRSEARALALDERARIAAGFGSAGRLEALAIPLVMHGVVYGFAYYGERSDGAAFTSEERALLGDLVASACAAFDHIEADRARERIRELEARLQRAGVAT